MSDVPTYRLTRLVDDGHATYGQLVDAENHEVCRTLELPWKDNQHDESCVPPGIYPAHRRLGKDTRHGYDVFELDGVPNRQNIQIHIANKPTELRGCIAIGETFGMLDGERAVLNSRAIYRDAWMARNVGIDHLQLVIVGPDHSSVAP